ncbi:MAG: sialate O-acetylesterase [Adhaeribacter sp.]
MKSIRFAPAALLWLALAWLAVTPATAKIALPAVIGEHMVLQQKSRVPLWGKAAPNAPVSVVTSWNRKKYSTRADARGDWQVKVQTPAAGGPYAITFDDGQALALQDILIGEVWVCSGQSNMEMALISPWGNVLNYQQEIDEASFPQIRLLQVEHATSPEPQADVKVWPGGWQACSPRSVPSFSAVAYFFARHLYQHRRVPLGIIHTSWGGTPAEAWTSGPALKQMPVFAPLVRQIEEKAPQLAEARQKYESLFASWHQQVAARDPGYRSGKAAWAAPNLPTAGWKTMVLPGFWEQAGLPDFDGVVWFRRKVVLPRSWQGQQARFTAGGIDDQDITWVNGVEVGATNSPTQARSYAIPEGLLREGENVITVRVVDIRKSGGIHGNPKTLALVPASGSALSLAGEWQYRVALEQEAIARMPQAPPASKNDPTGLYNAMIHPLIPFSIRGAIWYQGESNAARAAQYRELFPRMIRDWRQHWNQGDFPFYFVQLANYQARKEQPSESDWAELREAQAMTLALPQTGMAVAIDLGEAGNIHPKNKQDVGTRLALIARARTYGEKIPYSGPVFKSYVIEKDKVRLSFNHTDGGLQTKGDATLQGFALAGSDQKFYWAQARIAGKEVVVWCSQVPKPLAVRYAWADNPAANLYNGAGLPAVPFRTSVTR